LGQCASLTVVDLADRVMPSVLDAECAAAMADHLRSLGVDRNIAILLNAYLQGETAGINMAGGAAAFEAAFPVNAMGIKDFYLLTAGSTAGEPVTVRGEDGGLRKFYIADDRLVGFIILGDCQRAGIYTDMIRNGTKLSSADWEALLKTPQLAAFEKDVRLADLARAH
jgi:NADPH-dependent 2,4-dienoyl-CoA reductase/sulfur reductase-like enzyme